MRIFTSKNVKYCGDRTHTKMNYHHKYEKQLDLFRIFISVDDNTRQKNTKIICDLILANQCKSIGDDTEDKSTNRKKIIFEHQLI